MKDKRLTTHEKIIKECNNENKELYAQIEKNNKEIEKRRRFCRELKGRDTA